MSKQLKVSANLVQDLSEAEQAQARANIGAASASALSTLSNTVGTISGKVAGLESAFAPEVATGTVQYSDTSVPLIGDMSYLKVYCFITANTGCQIKIVPVDDHVEIGAFRSITHCFNPSLDTMRHDLPFDPSQSEAYSGYIYYDANSYGSMDIDVLLTDETSVHLTVWFKVDTSNTAYQFYVVEEARS